MNSDSASAAQRRALRLHLRERRNALTASVRIQAADAVARHWCAHPLHATPGYVAGYWAVQGELPLHALQLRLAPGQIWCLPLLQPDNSLRFAPWRAGDPLQPNRYGIPEPVVDPASLLAPGDLALAFVPLVGFDRQGGRLGAGGGYYDRSFAFRRTQAAPPLLIGVAFACQELPAMTREAWDVDLDAIVCESGLIVPAE
ncbi:MAG TPA: 5-formyltetrahydrofolate cyclo-ligase [Arenimonas sp.]|nr:5-formyltetrahydrofolate cyclo-ligase [Arenimonas sp.]